MTLTFNNVAHLNSIRNTLANNGKLTTSDQITLCNHLSTIPETSRLLLEKIPLNLDIPVHAFDTSELNKTLNDWVDLLRKLPGWDYCPFAFLVDNENIDLLQNNVIIVAWFAPSYAYNSITSSDHRAYELWLKDDGNGIFHLPTLRDAEQYPELYSFKGTWKEAYLLLIETLKKGWPMEEFPEELKPFLKK